MRTAMILVLLSVAVAVIATDDPGGDSITYEVVAVDGKLFLEAEPEPQRLNVKDHAVSGDRLRTGSSSTAAIGVPSHTTLFRLDAKTSCTLAHERPGVLLHVEKGRLRAIFGEFSGTEPRLVTTPSAVLAVRGTEYGIKVKKNGDTDLIVFSGIVEVTDIDGVAPPVRVEAGQKTRVRLERGVEAPKTHRMSPTDWQRGWSYSPQGMSGSGSGRGGSIRDPQSGSFGSSGAGAGAGSGAGSKGGGGGSKRRGG